ncbi:MAG: hypothetical protein ABIQ24_02930 [Nitrospiraceae bacterium]
MICPCITDVARTAVFFAGGIGITPFRSRLVWAAKEQLPQHLVLFYSNRRSEDAPFLDELHTGKEESKLHPHRDHDRHGEIASALVW